MPILPNLARSRVSKKESFMRLKEKAFFILLTSFLAIVSKKPKTAKRGKYAI